MNKYTRALIHIPCGMLKTAWLKLIHGPQFRGNILCAVSPLTEITLDRGGSLSIGRRFRMRDGAKLRVRRGAVCTIGDNVSVNSSNVIACHDRITIGNNVQFSPNVQIYDHDHDYRAEGGVNAMKYRVSPVHIGNDVWIGANTVILRGTELGDGCVVGAGSVIKGKYPAGTVVVQKRQTQCTQWQCSQTQEAVEV